MNASDKLLRSGYIQTIYKYLLGLIKKLDASIGSVRSRMNALIASPAGSGGDVGTELRDIRIGYDGTTYTSAGDAVRGQVSDIYARTGEVVIDIEKTYLPYGDFDLLRTISYNERYSDGFDLETRIPNWVNNTNYHEYAVIIPNTGTLKIGIPTSSDYQTIKWYALNSYGIVLVHFNAFNNTASSLLSGSITFSDGFCEVDCAKAKNAGMNTFSITYPVSLYSKNTCYCYLRDGLWPAWLNRDEIKQEIEQEIKQVDNKAEYIEKTYLPYGDFDLLRTLEYTNRQSWGYDISTQLPIWNNDDNYREYSISVPDNGILICAIPNFVSSDSTKWYILDSDGKAVGAWRGLSPNSNEILSGTITFEDNIYRVNCTDIKRIGGVTLSITYLTDTFSETTCYCKIYDGISPNWLHEKNQLIPVLVLPQKSTAVVGHEWNLYFDNIILGLSECYAVRCDSTLTALKQFNDCLRITPVAANIGSHTVTIKIIDKRDMSTVILKNLTLHIISDSTITNKKVMFIGDSLTDAGFYPAEIQHNLSNGGLVSVGTRTDTVTINDVPLTVNHEGRAGWAAYDYTHYATYKNADNAFWNPSTEKFDFSYYMSTSNVDEPDVICIGLGTNSLFDIDGSVSNLNMMITSIHSYDSDIKILIGLTTPPATQDGCGSSAGLQNSANLKHHELNQVKAYLETYENGVNVDVAELYFNLDTLHDFPTEQVRISARNPTTVQRQNNNVHPSVYGYLKMADVWYNSILYNL